MKKLLTLLMVLAMAGTLFAQVTFSGSAQVRPRLDVKDWGGFAKDGSKTGLDAQTDMYYMYRFRINMAATIGGGWYAKARLAHYGYAEYGFTSGLGMGANLGGDRDVTAKPSVAFTQMFLGYKNDTWGFMGGVIPMNGIANPMLDVHYYPNKMIDIPWTIYGLGSHSGFAGFDNAGPGKLNITATKDANNMTKENVDGTKPTDLHDTYSFGFNYDFKVAGFGIQPAVYYSWADKNVVAPITYGVNLTTPKFAGFSFGATAALTSNSVSNTAKYDGSFFRIKAGGKVGPGAISAWYDLAKRTDKGTVDVDHDYSYLWLMYKFTAYKGDHGVVVLAPRWRMIGEKVTNAMDFSRNKIEFLVIAKFK